MSKHTPGPWYVVTRAANPYWRLDGTKVSSEEGRIADCGTDGLRAFDACQANARLIAAAPEMLDMLIQFRKEFAGLPHSLGYDFTHLPKLDALIAKATGAA